MKKHIHSFAAGAICLSILTVYCAHQEKAHRDEQAILTALEICLETQCSFAPKKDIALSTPPQIAKRIPIPPVMPEWIAEQREFNAQLAQALED